MVDKRNDMVHSGVFKDVDDEDLMFLKRRLDFAFWWLIDNLDRLPTQSHLELFFEWCDKGHSHIAAAREVACFVEEQRKAKLRKADDN